MNKLEPICRVLAGLEWDRYTDYRGTLTREKYINYSWLDQREASRAIVQEQLRMVRLSPVTLNADYARPWLEFLLED